MDKPIIEIKNLKKQYRLGQIGSGTLANDLKAWWARIHHQEDPNAPLFAHNRKVGDTFMALNGVSFTVQPGEAVGIIGGNGAGKSTLLKLISRVTAPTEGEIILRGRVTSMLEVGTGFNGEMTGRENVYMNGAILGMTKAEIDAKIDEIIAFSECGDFIDTPVKRYSSGMYVKLAFSVAAHLDSEIMIMDEVLAVGDTKFQKKCLGKMGDAANNEGKTVLYVSHNMATIRQLCTRCVVLKEGRLIYDGDVEEAIRIYSEENTVTLLHNTFPQPAEYSPLQKAALLSADILDKDAPEFDTTEKLHLRLRWKALRNIESAQVRLILSTTMRAVATYYSDPMPCQPGEVHATDLWLDLSGLATDSYQFEIYLGEYDGMATENYAQQNHALGFSILHNPDQRGIAWQPAGWGNLVLRPSRLQDTREENT